VPATVSGNPRLGVDDPSLGAAEFPTR